MRRLAFDARFLEDLRYWVSTDRKTALRLLALLDAVARNPFAGIGSPERLRHFDSNTWSRRLTQADRVIYRVEGDTVKFLQGRFHSGS
ncbi:MAG: Txe/YoeB family addiction module toxin [Tepidiformaceae bacterium]